MGFNLFDLLLPRETKFFTYMEQQVSYLEKGCSTFKELVGKIETLSEDAIKKELLIIKDCEQNGDLVGSGIAAAFVLLGTAHFGIPVSTTHVISGSIMGVGAVEHAANVRWITARKIVWAWILTIPATALFAGGVYLLIGNFLLTHTR